MWKNCFHSFLIIALWIMELRIISSFTSTNICSYIPGLTLKQRRLCIKYPDVLIAIAEGEQKSADECQYQFKGYPWNCTQVWQKEIFGHVMFIASREAAFAYALASAGAAYTISEACANGNISSCSCDKHPKRRKNNKKIPNESWQWGGCSVDINYGMKFSQKFLSRHEIEHDDRRLMNLHNYEVGRNVVKSQLRLDCKCHGVSGSCTLKTCWYTLPPFRAVGDVLMRKYRRAVAVRGTKHLTRGLKLELVDESSTSSRAFNRRDLVYLDQSPNYCERDLAMGVVGTRGRLCQRGKRGPGGCELICCGRGFNTRQIKHKFRCRCKFQWCCEVKCDICEENYEEYTCK